MLYEVEQKFRVRDPRATTAQLEALGLQLTGAVEQIDRYFNHPSRDFAQTDEALRIRSTGALNRITYKGPKIDQATKTRQEIELPLADGSEAALGLREILVALGFVPVREVRKWRRSGTLHWQGETVEVAVDDVDPLGSFVELEQTASQGDLERARQTIARLAEQLGLSECERRSYLEMLLSAEGS